MCCHQHYFLCFILILVCVISSVKSDLICRSCGHSVTNAEAIKNVKSNLALNSYNMSVLGRDTTVQVFRNPVPETFHVITASGADLKFSGKSYIEDTWFPGFRWTACICSKCGSHMGWYFESSKEDFVGLILDYLISADYADTLTRAPLPQP